MPVFILAVFDIYDLIEVWRVNKASGSIVRRWNLLEQHVLGATWNNNLEQPTGVRNGDSAHIAQLMRFARTP